MRRVFQSVVAVALATFGLAASAQAATISYTSTFDPADVLFNNSGGPCIGTNDEVGTNDTVSGQVGGSCETLEYDHTLVGFTDPPDSLLSADLTLYFYDDQDPSTAGTPEAVKISLTGQLGQQLVGEVQLTTGGSDTLAYSVLFQIGGDGLLHVFLELGQQGSGQSDFFFAKSVLEGSWTDGSDIPEPAMLLLFGTGAFAAAARSRSRGRRTV